MLEDDSEIWAFAGGVYGDPEVEKRALALQDEFGADVVFVLFLIWLGLGGRRLVGEAGAALCDLSAEWQGLVIAPLRQVRRRLKSLEGPGAGEVYEALKASELASERLELQSLLGAVVAEGFVFDAAAGAKDAALANLKSYFRGLSSPAPWTSVRDSAGLIVDRAATWLRRQQA